MPQWVLYGLAALAIVTAIGGGYYWIDSMISSRDKKIEAQQGEIAALGIDLANLTVAYEASQKTIKNLRRDVILSQQQANRIKQQDAAERQRQVDFDRAVQGINIRDQTNLELINKYQECVSRDVNNAECAKILQ